jgi:HlyD family secretion protein
MSSRRRWLGLAATTAVLVTSGYFTLGKFSVAEAAKLPSAPATNGEFLVIVRARGELRARRSVQISGPVNVPELRIVWLAPSGEPVKEGDPVIRFDPSSARNQLNEKLAALEQAQATLEQAEAQGRITAEQDHLDLANTNYQVERAKLEVSKAEIVSLLQGEESRIDLGMAEQQLRVQQAKVNLNETSSRAKRASLERVRDQALAEVELMKHRLLLMELRAPLSGVIVYLNNFSQGWMNAKPFKVGDQVWPGAPLAEIPDLGTLEMEAKLDEIDRSRLMPGNEVRVKIDSLPELRLNARLLSISPLTQQSFEWPPTRTFRGYAPLENADPRLRPGMNGAMDIIIDRIANAVTVPAKAVFTKEGKPVIYIPGKKGYRALEVEILARNPDEIAIAARPEIVEMVALVEPENHQMEQP